MSAQLHPPKPTSKPRVLFIEGSAERRARIRILLGASGIDLDEATDVAAGMQLAAANSPDLVLMDDDMSDFDSGAGVSRIRGALHNGGDSHHVPLIVHGTPAERAGCESAGCDAFFEGPIESESLPELLRAYLSGQRDADEAVRLQREASRLANENATLRDQLSLRHEFLRNLAHELATPLTPLAGYVQLLASARLGELNERQRKATDCMTTSIDRMGRCIDNLMDYATLESGEFRVHEGEIDLVEVVDAIVEEYRGRARDRHLKVEVRKPAHISIAGDNRRLRQAFSNLIDNAIRVSPHGGRLLIEVTEKGDGAQVTVFDQGPGMPPEAAHSQSGTSTTHFEIPGAGFGLPVARRIAEAHGGRFILESPPIQQPDMRDQFSGSRVGFWIPRRAPQ